MRKEFHSEEFAAKALGCSFWRKPSRSNWKMIDYSRIALNFARLSWCSYLSFIFIFVEVNRCIAAASATQRIREQYLQAGWWCREGNLFVHFIMWFYLTHKLLSALFGDGGYRRYVPLLVIVLDCLGGTLSDRGSGGSRPRRGNRRHRGCHFWWVWVVASEISSAFWLSLILKATCIPIRLRGDGLVGVRERRYWISPKQSWVPRPLGVHVVHSWLRRVRRPDPVEQWGAGGWRGRGSRSLREK